MLIFAFLFTLLNASPGSLAQEAGERRLRRPGSEARRLTNKKIVLGVLTNEKREL